MKILVINGPNLNFLGIREPEIYGTKTYPQLEANIRKWAQDLSMEVEIIQSNHEGVIIDMLQQAYYEKVSGIIINPGAYTHYSYAIHDAISSIMIPTVEVHLSDINTREEFRKISVIKDVCVKSIIGHGFIGYKEALEYFLSKK